MMPSSTNPGKDPTGDNSSKGEFRIEGKAQLEANQDQPQDLKLMAYAFDKAGHLLGTGDVDREGGFNIPVNLAKPADVELFVGPTGDPAAVRQSSAYSRIFPANDWVGEGRRFVLRAEIYLSRDIWWPWRPLRVCIAGRVRKTHTVDGHQESCPVSFAKVEIFDVDREGCWWPYIIRWLDVLRQPVVRVPDLMKDRPNPPDPIGPIARLSQGITNPGVIRGFNPQPDPPRQARGALPLVAEILTRPGAAVSLNPQPLPPKTSRLNQQTESASMSMSMMSEQFAMSNTAASSAQSSSTEMMRVGEMRSVSPAIASRLENLTLTSRVAPWLIFPRCFYSRRLVCQTYTDCNGNFRCCFRWPVFHFRNGRLRFDSRPDIIIRITQVINGVETVIYMDPYTSTRWNVTNAYIDLTLDNEEIVCGSGCGPDTGLGNHQAALLQIGSDPVWQVNQANGMYTVPPVGNAAYGGSLYLRGDFSADMKTGPKRYYRLSYAKEVTSGVTPPNASFVPIKTPLSALRAVFLGSFETYSLGPHPDDGTPLAGLYEVQDTSHWWLMPGTPGGSGMVIGLWETAGIEPDEGTYILRMEVFDDAGTKLAATQFPNHGGNGTGIDPVSPPIVTDHLDLKFHLDNKPMSFDLTTPATNACGVVPWSASLTLNFHVHAEQENGRVDSWDLKYVKGVDPTRIPLGAATYNNGQSPVDVDVNGNALLVEPVTPTNPTGQLQSTCAFALILNAWLHVRDNWGFNHYGEKIYAIAIEKCNC